MQGITFPKVALYNLKAGYLKFKFLDCGGFTVYRDPWKGMMYTLRRGRTALRSKILNRGGKPMENSWLRPIDCPKFDSLIDIYYAQNGKTNHLHSMCVFAPFSLF